MTIRTNQALCFGWLLALLLVCASEARAESDDIKLEVQLIWATNDRSSPDPHHQPVSPELRNRLKELPLKWSNYFEVNRKSADLGKDARNKVVLSKECEVEIKNLGATKVEVALIGKGEKVVKRTQALPKGEILVLGGNAPNETAWLVVIKRTK